MSARSITIVGAGQSGLQLALGLLQHGYDVRLVSDRTPEEIRDGRVASSQSMFPTALSYERQVGVDLWDDGPFVEGVGFTMADPASSEPVFSWKARLDGRNQSVDQRVKYPALIELIAAKGGDVVYEAVDLAGLERYAAESELVVVAAGKGEIAQLFERDDARCTFDSPQRALALTYVHGLKPHEDFSRVSFNAIPGIGEYFVFQALTLSGPCDIFVFEGIPGGPMDCWAGLTPEEHLQTSLDILRTYLPWEAERATDVTLTDDLGILQGRFAPVVRKAVAALPSGRSVLGLADVVVLNDPITGQGSNNAAKAAHTYLHAILDHGRLPYDRNFQQATFERYWVRTKPVVDWTNALLVPPAPHMQQVLGAAVEHPQVAWRFANGFDDPMDFSGYFLSPEGAAEYLAGLGAG